MADNKMFEVEKGKVISSIKYGRDFKEGEVIDLGFASDEDIAALVESGAVKPSKKTKMTEPTPEQAAEIKEAKKAEVTNG